MEEICHVVMCAPEHYGVQYDINPWMTGNMGHVNVPLAKRQWLKLVDTLRENGCRVTVISGAPVDAPDAVFTANAGQIKKHSILISNFRHAERRIEEAYFVEQFSALGFSVKTCDNFYEGQGDTVVDHDRRVAFIGTGHRSAKCSGKCVKEFLGDSIDNMLALELVDDRFYHLDTCLALVNGYAVLYPGAFSDVSQKVLHTIYREKYLPVSEKDASYFACNLKQVGDKIILNKASAALKKQFAALGLTVIQTDMSEFMKAGGSVRCLTLDVPL